MVEIFLLNKSKPMLDLRFLQVTGLPQVWNLTPILDAIISFQFEQIFNLLKVSDLSSSVLYFNVRRTDDWEFDWKSTVCWANESHLNSTSNFLPTFAFCCHFYTSDLSTPCPCVSSVLLFFFLSHSRPFQCLQFLTPGANFPRVKFCLLWSAALI